MVTSDSQKDSDATLWCMPPIWQPVLVKIYMTKNQWHVQQLWNIAWIFFSKQFSCKWQIKKKKLVSLSALCFGHCLTLYTSSSIWIFFIPFSIHFIRCWQGESVKQSRVSFVCDRFLYSGGLDVWFRGGIVKKN